MYLTRHVPLTPSLLQQYDNSPTAQGRMEEVGYIQLVDCSYERPTLRGENPP